MNVAQETLGLRRGSFSLPLSLLMSAFALLIPPENLSILLRRPTERSPTARALLFARSCCIPGTMNEERADPIESGRLDFHIYYALLAAGAARKRDAQSIQKGTHAPAASVCSLSPVTSSAQDDSTSELLRFL
jgi:hypothetical protein